MALRHAVRAFRNAFHSPGFSLFGVRFARDYLWFALRCARSWGYTGPGMVKVLGVRIEYPNQSHALFLMHEVFVQATYAFHPRSRAPVVVDCGANVGFSTLFFKALHPGATILALEPEPDTCGWLRANVERNALRGVEIRQAAAADRDGTVTLFTPEADPGSLTSSLRNDWAKGAGAEVLAVRLSTLIPEPVDFLKLDVEGAEYAVIRELVASGALGRIREVVLEFHALSGEPDGPAALEALLAGAGMAVVVQPGDSPRTGIMRARQRSARQQAQPVA
jgi:FkbM family methyltransferase